MRALLLIAATLVLSACGDGKRRLAADETLLQVSAVGRAEAKPDEARFSAGVSSIAASAAAATQANNVRMNAVVAALTGLGIAKDDIQTQQLTVSRIDYGVNKNKFEVNNVVAVRVRALDKASTAIGAATEAGANILSGPSLRVSDDAAVNSAAYAAAYKAARVRADALAAAAGLKVTRILSIRDGTAAPPQPYDGVLMEQSAMVPRPVSAPPVMGGTDTTIATVSIDVALGK